MTNATAANKARLTHAQWAGIQTGRIARVHFERATIEKRGNRFLMTGPTGEHSIDIDSSSLDRVNAHWVSFVSDPRNQYPA